MSEWKTVRLGDVCEIITGNTPSTKNEQYYSSKDIPFVKPSDLPSEFFSEIDSSEFYLSEDARSVSRIIPENCVLVSCIGIIGKTGITKREVAFNQQINALKPNHNQIDYKYLASAILSRKNYISEKANAAVVPIINKTDFSNLQIPLPTLATQKQIAAQLDKCTALIAKHKLMLEKYDTLIKSRFIEMFGDPVQNPMGWEVKKLGKMCSAIMNGTTPKGGEQVYVDNGITFLRSQNVWRNKIDLEDVAYIDEATHKSMKKSSLKKYDILMTKTGRINTENSSLGRAALFLGEDDSANINGHVYLIRLEKEYNHEFVIRILTSPEYRDYIRSVCVGGIDKRQVNKDHIEDFPIIQPPKELQDEYSAFVQQIDKSKFAVQKSLEKAETLYKSLMQEYFG